MDFSPNLEIKSVFKKAVNQCFIINTYLTVLPDQKVPSPALVKTYRLY